MPIWEADHPTDLRYLRLKRPSGTISREIMQALASLGNSITANTASKTLTALRAKYPRMFQDAQMKARALEMLASFPLKQAVRRFIWELFDIILDEGKVHDIMRAREAILRPDDQVMFASRLTSPTSLLPREQALSDEHQSLPRQNGSAEEHDDATGAGSSLSRVQRPRKLAINDGIPTATSAAKQRIVGGFA